MAREPHRTRAVDPVHPTPVDGDARNLTTPTADPIAHVALASGAWLRERGVTGPILDWRDPLTEGPLAPLDAAGVALRSAHWGGPGQGEIDLLPHVAGAREVVVWGPERLPAALVRAWVRSVVPGIPVHEGRVGGDGDWRAHVHRVPADLDRQLWDAAIAPDPHGLIALLDAEEPWRDAAIALLRWLPRADTGLNAWEHALLAAAAGGPATVARRVAEVVGAPPRGGIGDLTLRDLLAALEGIGAVTTDGDGWRSTLVLTPRGERLHRGVERATLPPRRVGGLVAGPGGWEVRDHERFGLTPRRPPDAP